VLLSGIQFTKHFIEFFVVETNQLVGNNPNVILMQLAYSQHWSMPAAVESKQGALKSYFSA